jgi:hypothetical protein
LEFPTAVAEDKSEDGVALVEIGYNVDLATRRVGLSPKCLDRTFFAFFDVREREPVGITTMEQLASFASRYSKVCRSMRPFCVALYSSYTGRKNLQATFTLDIEAQLAIRLWRAVLCCSYFEDGIFTREIATFAPRFAGLVVEFDASLSGIGVLIYQRDAHGLEVCVGGGAVALENGGFGHDSSFQNTAEFIGATVGIALAASMGYRDQTIELRGDSISALIWGETERYRGFKASNAAVVYTMFACAARLNGIKRHLPAADNWRADKLSRKNLWKRGETVEKMLESWGPSFASATVLTNVGNESDVASLVRMCTPGDRLTEESSFLTFWRGVRSLVDIMSPPASLSS